jgi:hypothetical protein
MFLGGLLLRSAYARRAQITEFRQEMQREAWRHQARAAQGLAPDNRGTTTVIRQGIWNEYAAPPESWSQTLRGVLILGLIVALVSGLILLYVEYAYFQVRWSSSRNWEMPMTSADEAQFITRVLLLVAILMALVSPGPNLLLAAESPQRTLIRSVPAGNMYSYENAMGETVEEMENRQGKLISRRFYRPALPACAYLRSVGLTTDRYWRDDGE